MVSVGRRRFRLSSVTLVLLLLAGCSSPGDGHRGDALPLLSEFTSCAFTYPDGTPIPCENRAKPLQVTSSPPETWLCYAEPSSGVSYFRSAAPAANDPQRYDFGLRLIKPQMEPPGSTLHGVIEMTTDGGTRFYNWSTNLDESFVTFPEPLGGQVTIRFHATATVHESTHEGLSAAQLHKLWSDFDGSYWVLYRLDLPAPHYFHPMVSLPGYGYAEGNIKAEGADFNLTVLTSTIGSFSDTFDAGFPSVC